MSRQIRVNISSAVNSAAIRREQRDGREYIIVPSVTLPDDIIMNGSAGLVRYPADEIAKSFAGLEGTPAPLDHPKVNGVYVSARSPEGLVRGWIGAWNENVRQENGRVHLDKVIDVETASALKGGKLVLDAIDKGDPIHTSVGVFMMLAEDDTKAAKHVARDMLMDHDAILIGKPGAATPDDGVGMMVNSAKSPEGELIDVINSFIEDDIERDQMWALESFLRGEERKDKLPLLKRLKAAIDSALGRDGSETDDEEETTEVDQKAFDDLKGTVSAISATVEGLGGVIANAVAEALKPFNEAQEAAATAAAAAAETERAALADKVVNAGLLDADTAKEATIAVLNGLAAKIDDTPGRAATVNAAFKPSAPAAGAGFALPKGD